MDKKRYEYLKGIVEIDYQKRHDTPQMYFTSDDLKNLFTEIEEWKRDSEMYQEYLDREKNLYYFANEKRREYEAALREIDTHIRADSEPIPYIIKTLKNILSEYKK